MIHVPKREHSSKPLLSPNATCRSTETISLNFRHPLDLSSLVFRVRIGMKFA
jgi:hypothetical protein